MFQILSQVQGIRMRLLGTSYNGRYVTGRYVPSRTCRNRLELGSKDVGSCEATKDHNQVAEEP